MSEVVQVRFKFLHEETLSMQVQSDTTVHELKERVCTATQKPVDTQRMIYKGKVLKNPMTLEACHFVDGDTIHVVSRPPPSDAGHHEDEGHAHAETTEESPSTPYISMHFIRLRSSAPSSPSSRSSEATSVQTNESSAQNDESLLHRARQWREETARVRRPTLNPLPTANATFVSSAHELSETLSNLSSQLNRLAWVVNQAPDDRESVRQMDYIASLLESMGPFARRLHATLTPPTPAPTIEAPAPVSATSLFCDLIRAMTQDSEPPRPQQSHENSSSLTQLLTLSPSAAPWTLSTSHPAQDILNILYQVLLPQVSTTESQVQIQDVHARLQHALDQILGLQRPLVTSTSELERRVGAWAQAACQEYEAWLNDTLDTQGQSRLWDGVHKAFFTRFAMLCLGSNDAFAENFNQLLHHFVSTLVWILVHQEHASVYEVLCRLLDKTLDSSVAQESISPTLVPYLRQHITTYLDQLISDVLMKTTQVIAKENTPIAP